MKIKTMIITAFFKLATKLTIFLLSYLINVLKSLKIIHFGTAFVVKIKASMKLGFLLSPFAVVFVKLIQPFNFIIISVQNFFHEGMLKDMMDWYFGNLSYITIVGFAIIIDHGLGTWKHLRMKDFSVKKNIIGLMTKVGLVVACGILFEGLNIIIQKDLFVKDYLTIVTRLIVFLYPAGSAFGNSAYLSNGKFPPQKWLDWLKSYQKNLDPKVFSNNENIEN